MEKSMSGVLMRVKIKKPVVWRALMPRFEVNVNTIAPGFTMSDGLVKSQYLDDFEKSAVYSATAGQSLSNEAWFYVRRSDEGCSVTQ